MFYRSYDLLWKSSTELLLPLSQKKKPMLTYTKPGSGFDRRSNV